ncbi:FkbM family methyltransferase [Aeromonas sp.]|uniref:FkbM family methyltransferase n=1 Tax=Aeromonas sp. TaxID=647 RepID=UPI00258826DF|nr:FkbM family methyltransferase [Aeromonas sp.]MCX7131150.1 FkbM family methyltransferase [Aeromonas sp.]
MGELQVQVGNVQPISAWLDVLGAVMPPRGVLVVGAGAGNGPWVQWLRDRSIRPVWLVEGDKTQYQHLVRSLLADHEWTLRHDVVAETTDAVVFHHASNPAESGLIAPKRLRSLWPHLELVGVEDIEAAVTLEALFVEAKGDINWLVLDCLPAAALLIGAGQLLAKVDLVVVRVACDEQLESELGAHHGSADPLLLDAGLTCVHLIPQRHPALMYAIYVRDVVKQKADQVRDRVKAAQLRQMLQQSHVNIQEERVLATQQVRGLETQLEQRIAEQTILQQAFEQLEQQLAQQGDALRCNQEELRTTRLAQEQADADRKQELALATQQVRGLETQLEQRIAEQATQQRAFEQLEQQLAQQGDALRCNQEELRTTRLAQEQDDADRKQELALATQQVRGLETQLEQHIAEQATQQRAFEQLEQQLAQQGDALRDTEELLIQAQQAVEQANVDRAEQKMLAEQSIHALNDQLKKQQLRIDELLNGQAAAQKAVANATNDTIGFDNFIEDIEPYLFGKSITYVDVGAFVGDVFKYIVDSKKIRVREAHLIEPNPESYEKLTSGVQKNRIPALHTYNMGISDTEQILRFSAAASMTKVVANTHSSVVSGDSCDIKCSRLDEFSQFFTDGRIDLLKIDVEGHELAALRGAETLLKNSRIDIIYIEVGFNISGTQQTYFSDVDQFLQKYGYRCFNIYEKTSEWVQDTPWLRRCNFAYFSSPFAINNPRKLTLENRRLQQLLNAHINVEVK